MSNSSGKLLTNEQSSDLHRDIALLRDEVDHYDVVATTSSKVTAEDLLNEFEEVKNLTDRIHQRLEEIANG